MKTVFKTLFVMTPAIATGLVMTACRDQASTLEKPTTDTAVMAPATTLPATVSSLGSINLDQPVRVLGTEPFWHIDITPAALTFTPVEGPKHLAENKGATLQGQTAVWNAQTQAGMDIQVTASLKDCSDGMSDRIYPLTATVKLGEETFKGCAASLKAIEAVGESGRVE